MNTCCEACFIDFSEKDKFDCSDSSCKCHQEKPTHEIGWEEDKKEWLATFEADYGDSLMSKCIGIVARAMYHEQLAPKGADASYITTKLHSLFTHQKESMVSKLEGMNNPNKDGDYEWCGFERARADAIEVILTTQ